MLAALAGVLAALHGVDRGACGSRCRTRVAVVTVLAFSAAAPLGDVRHPGVSGAPRCTHGRDRDRGAHGPTSRRKLVALAVAVHRRVAVAVGEVRTDRRCARVRGCRGAGGGPAHRRRGLLDRRRARACRRRCSSARTRPGTAAGPSYASGDHFVNSGEMTGGRDRPELRRSVRSDSSVCSSTATSGSSAWSPVFLLAIPAFAYFVRRRPPRWDVLVIPLAVGWFNATFVALTMHGWWWPGRQVGGRAAVRRARGRVVGRAEPRRAVGSRRPRRDRRVRSTPWLIARGHRRRPHHGRHVRNHHAPGGACGGASCCPTTAMQVSATGCCTAIWLARSRRRGGCRRATADSGVVEIKQVTSN